MNASISSGGRGWARSVTQGKLPLVLVLVMFGFAPQERENQRQPPQLKQSIKRWEYRKFEKNELVAIFKGEETRIAAKGEYDITKPSMLYYTEPEGPHDVVHKIQVNANKGYYNDKEQWLDLREGVSIAFVGEETLLTTSSIHFDITKHHFSSNDEFHLKASNMDATGKGFEADELLGVVFIKSNVRLKRVAEKSEPVNVESDAAELYMKKQYSCKNAHVLEGAAVEEKCPLCGASVKPTLIRELDWFVAQSQKFARVTTGVNSANVLEAPKIVGYVAAGLLILKGPKRIKFEDALATAEGDVAIHTASKRIFLLQKGEVHNPESHISADQLVMDVQEDNRPKKFLGSGNVQVENLNDGTRIFGDFFAHDFATQISFIRGNPMMHVTHSSFMLAVGELEIDEKEQKVEGRRGQRRSTLEVLAPHREQKSPEGK